MSDAIAKDFSVPDVPASVAKRAVEWIIELQSGDDAERTEAAIQDWCTSHPDHQRAWDHIGQLNQRINMFTLPERAGIFEKALAESKVSRRSALSVLSAIVVSGGAALSLQEMGALDRWRSDYYTDFGEQQRLTLADGTEITLNSRSAIQIEEHQIDPRLKLLHGEVYIATRKPTSRPLYVEVEQGVAYPMGTGFALRQHDDFCRLAVYDGQVSLRPRDTKDEYLIQSGESALFTKTGLLNISPIVEDEAAWIDGVIVARGMPLSTFVAELGRHRAGILRVDPAIAELKVSGTYPITETDRALRLLTTALPIRLSSITPYWVTLVEA